jgi:hypothetical protein
VCILALDYVGGGAVEVGEGNKFHNFEVSCAIARLLYIRERQHGYLSERLPLRS